MSKYVQLQADLMGYPRTWLVTGEAGFIGSNLLEKLLQLDQRVVGLDNLSTGHRRNLDEVKSLVTSEQWARFRWMEGDISRLEDCHRACAGVDLVLHQAALGSVPRSLENPIRSHAANVSGFLNLLVAARDARVKRFVYASSSSVYGDHPALPKREETIGRSLSPYAATKLMDEVYADVFQRCYGLSAIGLRYFNVFGPRQDPNGAYAAVIPKWFAALLQGDDVKIYGDGETSRDFCYITDVVQANLLAAITPSDSKFPTAFNVACGERTTLLQLFEEIRGLVAPDSPKPPVFLPERAGDVRHSLADISRVQACLGYAPTHSLEAGLKAASAWYGRQGSLSARNS